MKRIKGFTMVELIITLTIVVILSLVSWPIYRQHRLNEVSLLAEGYALVGAIKEAQISYYNEYGNFLCGSHSYTNSVSAHTVYTSFDPVLGINVMNNKYFSAFTYDVGNRGDKHWVYEFRIRVFGNFGKDKIVEIIQPFNLTERNELTVIGNGTTTIR